MYIEPNTTIHILKDCPLDNTYDHTLYFALEPEQESYFKSLTKYTLDRHSYQRHTDNFIRVEIKADNLFDCNYMMFQNQNFGNKWFYAFIKNATYVNNVTAMIEYELDPMQTWYFDYNLGQCFVEREHTFTDKIGDNIVNENLNCGEYLDANLSKVGLWDGYDIIIACTFDKDFNEPKETTYNGLFSGLYLYRIENSVAGRVIARTFINDASAKNKADGIVAIGFMPAGMYTQIEAPYPHPVQITKQYPNKRTDGKPPKNNKLNTFPFTYLSVSNNTTTDKIYRMEFFEGTGCNFNLYAETNVNPTVALIPVKYKGADLNTNELITLSGFPMVAWVSDTYKAWLAQNGTSNTLAAINSVGNGIISAAGATMISNPLGAGLAVAGAGLSTVSNIANLLNANLVESTRADKPNGSQGGSLFAALDLLDFYYTFKCLTPEFVDIIDDYFNMFGYACKRVKIPNRNARPHWTYTKTVNCVITGSLPSDDANKICSIYNNGITFWKNGNEVGNYALDNSPEG